MTAKNQLSLPAKARAEEVRIGTQVWYHSRDTFKARYEQGRIGFVTGPGAQVSLMNLSILPDPLIDVENARVSPVLVRRNVVVFDCYPRNWPMEDFAVVCSQTILEMFSLLRPYDNRWGMHGGKNPILHAGRAQDGGDGEANFRINTVQATPATLGLPLTSPAPTPEAAIRKYQIAQTEDKPQPSAGEPATAPIVRLVTHPAWSRCFGELVRQPRTDGDRVIFESSSGLALGELTHSASPPRGYVLKSGKKNLAQGQISTTQAGAIIRLASQLFTAGESLTKPGQVAKLVSDVMADAQNADNGAES